MQEARGVATEQRFGLGLKIVGESAIVFTPAHPAAGQRSARRRVLAMFNMTFDFPERGLVVHGESAEGETWEGTFLRLYQSLLPPGSPARRIAHAERRGRPSGAATNTVVTAYHDGAGRLALDRPVLIRTRPPQF
jgi:hypothetical protein